MPTKVVRTAQAIYGNTEIESGYQVDFVTGASLKVAGVDVTPKVAALAANRIVSVLEQTVLKSAFTDGGGTSGTFVMGSIPAGSIILATKVLVPAAWTGDTSAVIVIGDGSDVDRYMTGTPSVFTLAAAGIEVGVPSGSKLLTVANTPTITVTSAADFTNVVGTGSVTVSIYYIAAT